MIPSTEASVSVVMPTKFESELILIRSLMHLLPQLFPGDEVVLVDGSPNTRREILEQLPYPRAKLINRIDDIGNGITHARNLGIASSTRDTIVFLDSDCVLSPSSLHNIRSSVNSRTVVQGGYIDHAPTNLASHHAVWRRVVTQARVKASGTQDALDGRFLAFDRRSVTRLLGPTPFDETNISHGGECKLFGRRATRGGLDIVVNPQARVTHIGDPPTLHSLLRQKYLHNLGESLTGVLPDDMFLPANFARAVTLPTEVGVDFRFAILFWAWSLLGASAGLKMCHENKPSTVRVGRNY